MSWNKDLCFWKKQRVSFTVKPLRDIFYSDLGLFLFFVSYSWYFFLQKTTIARRTSTLTRRLCLNYFVKGSQCNMRHFAQQQFWQEIVGPTLVFLNKLIRLCHSKCNRRPSFVNFGIAPLVYLWLRVKMAGRKTVWRISCCKSAYLTVYAILI